LEKPDESRIQEVLARLGKTSPADELNCGSCGYNTCREKAAAVLQGKAELTMCLPYMMKRAEGFSDTVVAHSPDGILVLSEELEVQKINPVACRLFRVRDEKDVLGEAVDRLLDDTVFRTVRKTGRNRTNEREYLSEYGCYVDRTVLFNADSHLFICMMRDVTNEVERLEKKLETRLQAVAIADDVAKKQLKIVQDIASLLGETAADTLIAIDHLKETISDD
jgi:PAS domain-containing protein